MNKITINFFLLLLVLLFVQCNNKANDNFLSQNEILAKQKIDLENKLSDNRNLASVVIPLSELNAKLQAEKGTNLLVTLNSEVIPSQLDDLDGDGIVDELVFQVSMAAKSKIQLLICKVSDEIADRYIFESEVYAQMGMKNGKMPFIKKDSIYSESGDLYKPIMHHGPATESELMAYRMYFDDRCSIDIYGKMHRRLELETTNWYSNDSLITKQYGGDILFVKNTLGVGSPRIWNGKETQLLKATKGRYAVVRSKGPVRTIIDMVAPNIESVVGNTKVLLRMIQYAGKREMNLQVFADGNLPQFCTGVRKMKVSKVTKDEEKSFLGLWGTEFPRLDHEKYPQVTVGLGVVMSHEYFDGFDKDDNNHLMKLKGNKTFVEYIVTAAFQDEKEGFKDAQSFFDYLDRLSLEINSPLKLSRLK
ncbi:DUF4861 family protein [Ancylomarina sp. YFZ004]